MDNVLSHHAMDDDTYTSGIVNTLQMWTQQTSYVFGYPQASIETNFYMLTPPSFEIKHRNKDDYVM